MSSAIVMAFSNSLPTAPTAYAVAADLAYGSNGNVYGSPELGVGQGSNFSTGRLVWDSSDSDPFQSALIGFDFSIPAGGGTSAPSTLSFSNVSSPISFGGSTYGNLGSVVIDSGTQVNGSVVWSGLTINFLHNGAVVDSWTSASGAQVDTTDSSNPVAGQQITVSSTSSQTITSIDIQGSFEMTAVEGAYPDINDLFSDLYVIGA